MDIIYIPYDVENQAIRRSRIKLLREFFEHGWEFQGLIELKDGLGTALKVFVLERS